MVKSTIEREVNTMDKTFYADEIESCAAALYKEE